jgi:outer membrane receptor protein involved in Fe transport
MIKRNLLALILFILFQNQGFSQVTIIGQIKDKNNKSIEFIEVQLQNKDSIIVKSELTNIDGKFTIITEKGEYQLMIKQLGKILLKQKLSTNQDLNLGIIKISENQQQLKEVVVNSKKKLIERKVDRLVFNVENSISATGGDAIDALKLTPGIKVQNDAITMIGKSAMAVMINDKIMQISGDDLVNFLKTIASDNIKSIEVITTPPSKYDAEGNSGLINIKLKKSKPDSWNTTIRSGYTQKTYGSERLGGNFMYQKKKLSLLVDLSSSNDKYIYTNDITYQYPVQNWKTSDYMNNKGKSVNASLVIDYKITEKMKFGLSYLGSLSKYKIDETYQSNIFNQNLSNLDQLYNTIGISDADHYNHSINLNAEQKLDTLGKKISIDFDYFTRKNSKVNPFYTTNSDYLIPQTDYFYTNNISTNLINNYSAKIDFEMPYQWANLEYGAKLSFTTNDSNVNQNFYQINNNTTNPYLIQNSIFNYKENNQAIYISADKKITKKWDIKAGLRLETTQTTGFSEIESQTNKNKYTKFFPTLYLSYKFNDNNTFSINFARRISRPSYSELNPARWYQNLNSYEVGNPFLQPSFANNIEISHNYKELFISTLSYSNTENGYSQLTIHDFSTNTQTFVRQNYFTQSDLTFSETFNSNPFKWWSITATSSVFYAEINAYSAYLAPKYSGWGGDFNTTHSFTINKAKTLAAQLMYLYSFKQVSQESIIEPLSSFSLALKYAILDKKLQFSLYANNIFGSDRMIAHNTSQGIYQSFKQYYDSQFIRFSISYKFGNNKVNIQNRESSNQEEKNRAN